jgi:hypothetical protein
MEELENLRPMSRSEFEVLYRNCLESGWVQANFNLENLYFQFQNQIFFFSCLN